MSVFTAASSATRNIGLPALADLLKDQSTRKLDVIAGAGALRACGGRLILDGTQPQLGPDGVTMTTGSYLPNDVANEGLAAKLGIPSAYLKKLADEHIDLYDENVNGWLARDDRRFLIRVLRNDSGGGIARAVLSDRYSRIDNLDILLAALDGIRESGAAVQVTGSDVTDRRMYLRVSCPDVAVAAPELLERYRSPFNGRAGRDLPLVFAGFLISNSETGCGAFTITPRLEVQVCTNGLVINTHKMRSVHVGSKAEEDGVIEWSEETQAAVLTLVTKRTKDAVRSYLDRGFVARMIRELEQVAGKPVDDPDTTLKTVATKLRFSDDQRVSILNHFIKGADLTAGGVLHAVTSVAQTLADADAAFELESAAIPAMHIAAGA
jgi:hypothetical protein